MSEIIQWAQLSEEERNALIHEKVLGLPLVVPGTEGQLDPYMGNYWGCTCGWTSDFYIGDGDTAHTIPLPAYSTSFDAAWIVVKGWEKWQLEVTYVHEMHLCRAMIIRDDGSCLQCYGVTMAEAICITALRAKGYEVKL